MNSVTVKLVKPAHADSENLSLDLAKLQADLEEKLERAVHLEHFPTENKLVVYTNPEEGVLTDGDRTTIEGHAIGYDKETFDLVN